MALDRETMLREVRGIAEGNPELLRQLEADVEQMIRNQRRRVQTAYGTNRVPTESDPTYLPYQEHQAPAQSTPQDQSNDKGKGKAKETVEPAAQPAPPAQVPPSSAQGYARELEELTARDINRFQNAALGQRILRIPCPEELDDYRREQGLPGVDEVTITEIRVGDHETLEDFIDVQMQTEQQRAKQELQRKNTNEARQRGEQGRRQGGNMQQMRGSLQVPSLPDLQSGQGIPHRTRGPVAPDALRHPEIVRMSQVRAPPPRIVPNQDQPQFHAGLRPAGHSRIIRLPVNRNSQLPGTQQMANQQEAPTAGQFAALPNDRFHPAMGHLTRIGHQIPPTANPFQQNQYSNSLPGSQPPLSDHVAGAFTIPRWRISSVQDPVPPPNQDLRSFGTPGYQAPINPSYQRYRYSNEPQRPQPPSSEHTGPFTMPIGGTNVVQSARLPPNLDSRSSGTPRYQAPINSSYQQIRYPNEPHIPQPPSSEQVFGAFTMPRRGTSSVQTARPPVNRDPWPSGTPRYPASQENWQAGLRRDSASSGVGNDGLLAADSRTNPYSHLAGNSATPLQWDPTTPGGFTAVGQQPGLWPPAQQAWHQQFTGSMNTDPTGLPSQPGNGSFDHAGGGSNSWTPGQPLNGIGHNGIGPQNDDMDWSN